MKKLSLYIINLMNIKRSKHLFKELYVKKRKSYKTEKMKKIKFYKKRLWWDYQAIKWT